MNWTTVPCFVSVAFVLAVTAAGPADAKDTLSVAANAPAVPLAPRSPGRNFVRLPTLEFTFEIQADCSGSRSPESLSLNVADTRKSLTAEQIVSDGPTEISLQIPASQIAPLVIEDFCVLPLEEDSVTVGEAPSQITIPSALSAQAALLCAGDEDKAMTYVSRSLDVALVCEQVTTREESRDE